VHDPESHVAAQDLAALLGEAFRQRARDGGDARDGGNAERDAGEEDSKAFQAPAQLAQREAQDQRQAAAGGSAGASREEYRACEGLSGRERVGVDVAGAQAHHADRSGGQGRDRE
jgi:hypothetical protein